jgi:RimJ/RimL family protein N-acetyltransferase
MRVVVAACLCTTPLVGVASHLYCNPRGCPCHRVGNDPLRGVGPRSRLRRIVAAIEENTLTEPNFTFRPLSFADMPTMSRWLSDPVVAEWYEEGGTDIGHLTGKYRDMLEGREPTKGYIAMCDGVEIGYIQAVPIDSFPDYARQLDVQPGAVGIDLFLGEPAYRGRGIGSAMLREFTDRIVFGEMHAPIAIIGPSPENTRAVRSYEKAGFTYLKTVSVIDEEEPYNSGEEYIMTRFP